MIINNKDFVNDVHPTRDGSEKDLENLCSLFSETLRFTVTSRSNLTYPDMKKEILAFAGKEEHGEQNLEATVGTFGDEQHGRSSKQGRVSSSAISYGWELPIGMGN